MKHRLLFAALAAALLTSACGNVPTSGGSACQAPAYCGSKPNLDPHGQG